MTEWNSWTGKVLDIDLTSENISKVSSDKYFPKFLGGRGLEAKVLWDDVPEGTKAFDPENRIIFAPSTLTGTNSPNNGRWNIGSLSPSHPNEYPSSSAIGGHWGAELKFAGYDGVIVHGKASRPVYILIRDELIEIRSASNYWGLDAIEGQKRLADDISKEGPVPDMSEKPIAGRYFANKIRTVIIGAAGENVCRIACVIHDSGDAAGQEVGKPVAQAREHSALGLDANALLLYLFARCEITSAWRETRPPGCSAPCPPAFGLLLDLRRTPRRPDLSVAWFVRVQRRPFAAAGLGCLS